MNLDYKNCSGFVSVQYDGYKQSSYESVNLSIRQHSDKTRNPDREEIKFDSGNPILDFYALEKWKNNHELVYVVNSSSCDHFYMDGNKWKELPVLLPEEIDIEKTDDWIITTWEDFHDKFPQKYAEGKFLTVCVTSRFIGKSFSHLKKYYKKKIDKTNPLYN